MNELLAGENLNKQLFILYTGKSVLLAVQNGYWARVLDENPKCNYLSKSYRVLLSCGVMYFTVQSIYMPLFVSSNI